MLGYTYVLDNIKGRKNLWKDERRLWLKQNPLWMRVFYIFGHKLHKIEIKKVSEPLKVRNLNIFNGRGDRRIFWLEGL